MIKSQILRWANGFLMLSFLVQLVTGLVMFFKLRGPFVGNLYELHEYNGLLVVMLVVIHIFLNWNWIKMDFLKR